jgi:hypothetical protein
VRRAFQHAVRGARVGEVENLADRQVERSAFDHRRNLVEPVARDVDDEICRAHAFRPEIGLIRSARDGDEDQPLWDAVQMRLAGNTAERTSGTRARQPSLLTGMLFDTNGNPMTPATPSNRAPATATMSPAR